MPSVKGIASDIKNPDATKPGTPDADQGCRDPAGLWKSTQQHLSELTQPVLVYHGAVDHVVGPASVKLLRPALRPEQLEVRDLADSYHVATLDNDAEANFPAACSSCRYIVSRAGNLQMALAGNRQAGNDGG